MVQVEEPQDYVDVLQCHRGGFSFESLGFSGRHGEPGTSKGHMSYGFCFGLVSVIVSAWGNDMSVYMAIANNIHLGSHGLCGS